MAGVVVPPLVLYIKAPIAAPKSANGSGTVKNLMKSGFEIPAAGMKVSTRYCSREGTLKVIRTSIKLLKNRPDRKPMTPPARALLPTIRMPDWRRIIIRFSLTAQPVLITGDSPFCPINF